MIMTDYAKKNEELQKQIQELQEQMRENSKLLLEDQAKQFFEKYDWLESYAWTQYAPYFNDGDPCYFSVNNWAEDIKINGYGYYDITEGDLDVPEWIDEDWNLTEEGKIIVERNLEAAKEIAKFLETLDDGFLECTFGSDSIVTVTKNGIESEHYGDHD